MLSSLLTLLEVAPAVVVVVPLSAALPPLPDPAAVVPLALAVASRHRCAFRWARTCESAFRFTSRSTSPVDSASRATVCDGSSNCVVLLFGGVTTGVSSSALAGSVGSCPILSLLCPSSTPPPHYRHYWKVLASSFWSSGKNSAKLRKGATNPQHFILSSLSATLAANSSLQPPFPTIPDHYNAAPPKRQR